jgi:hypothetical protein
VQWLKLIISITHEVKIGRITIQDQPRQKVKEVLISTNKLDIVVHIWGPS